MERSEERALIERAADGDRTAAEALIRAHQASLYAFMLRMCKRPEIAEDIVQDAFVRVLGNLDRFDPRFRFSTWLFTIAKRLYMNAAAKMRPVYDTDIVGGVRGREPDSRGPFVEAEDEASNARAVLDQSLESLSADQREVIVLFHQLDWPIARIADHMGMPEGTVKSHLHRGRRRLRELIEAREDPAACSVRDALAV
ncbi:MAG: sigma-70 family RNA polymerase sigma factor [Planctomycetota bacterium]